MSQYTPQGIQRNRDPGERRPDDLHQYYLDCSSQASISSPTRTPERPSSSTRAATSRKYLADARELRLTIVGVITPTSTPTSSPVTRAGQATGAGSATATRRRRSSRSALHDGERIPLSGPDGVTPRSGHPGHTPESISVLVFEHGTDEGRPRRAHRRRPSSVTSVAPTCSRRSGTRRELGRMLHDSVQRKLVGLTPSGLPATALARPAARTLSTERQSTIGEQRRSNHACRPMDVDAFLAVVTEGQPPGLLRLRRHPQPPGPPAARADNDGARAELGGVRHGSPSAPGPRRPRPPGFAASHLAGAINIARRRRMADGRHGLRPHRPHRPHRARPRARRQQVATRSHASASTTSSGTSPPRGRHMGRAPGPGGLRQLAHRRAGGRGDAAGAVQLLSTSATPAGSPRDDPRRPPHPTRRARRPPHRPRPAVLVLVNCAGGWRLGRGLDAALAGLHRCLGPPRGYTAWKAPPKTG